MPNPRLDLAAIESSLREVQQRFADIDRTLDAAHDPLSEEVIQRLLAGYAYLNRLQAEDVDLLARGNSARLLDINCLVLFGRANARRPDRHDGFAATEQRFYDDSHAGGVRALMNYLADCMDRSIWRRAAGVYLHILSEPQLFLEGNHRSGTLVMSHVLLRAGKPPFVLTPANARDYFVCSTLAKAQRKRALRALVDGPRLQRRLARLLEESSDPVYLEVFRPAAARRQGDAAGAPGPR